jgi:iron-sulfur cluster assembly protein
MNDMAITLTERAATELRALMENEDKSNALLRIWVAGGGCSGLSYGMALDENDPEDEDEVFADAGVRVVVDRLSLEHMDGATVDYVDDMMGGGFKIENPNATKSCGCGSSFQTEGSGGCCGSGGGCCSR